MTRVRLMVTRGTCHSRCSRGSAGRYMSVASGGKADSKANSRMRGGKHLLMWWIICIRLLPLQRAFNTGGRQPTPISDAHNVPLRRAITHRHNQVALIQQRQVKERGEFMDLPGLFSVYPSSNVQGAGDAGDQTTAARAT
jgi:hypothetical protein